MPWEVTGLAKDRSRFIETYLTGLYVGLEEIDDGIWRSTTDRCCWRGQRARDEVLWLTIVEATDREARRHRELQPYVIEHSPSH
jgi:hypothetical protein